ncbi:MAG: rod shape-determining protein MreD [Methylococcales bacterium]|nr:rod shape-determining protein MreD [Methylococcales bacterium]MCK5926237.1 rod shape-determining protein MreD [Methylococcales bacterium]
MCLKVAPFPHFIGRLNPNWVLLVLIYWTLILPYQQGILKAWLTGLLTDVLVGCSLGEHTLIYVCVIYVCIIFHKRLRQFPMLQQMVFIFFCLLVAQMTIFWLESIRVAIKMSSLVIKNPVQTSPEFSISFWLSILTGTLIWPVINSSLDFIRHLGNSR